MKLVLYFLVTHFSSLNCQAFQPSNWTACPVIHENFKILKSGSAVSLIHCLTQCSSTLGCVAALWKGRQASDITEGKFYVDNETAICHITAMGTVIADQNAINSCTSAKNANASSYFLDNSFPPCLAFKDDNRNHYKSNQSLATISEWWYSLPSMCYIEKIKCRQQISSNETLVAYVLQDLTDPRAAKTFCDRQSGARDKDMFLTCVGLSGGRYVLIKKDVPGLLAISHVEIHGLC